MRSLLLKIILVATALGCRASGGLEPLGSQTPPDYHLGPNEWVQRKPGQSCTADARRSAFGCTITRCTESGPPDGGDGEYRQGFGRVLAECGETVDVCGRAYRCECETCSDVPDYAKRMSRKRTATLTPPDEKGIILFTVSYEGGKCEGVGSPQHGSNNLCHVSAWDDSHVGGCYRHTGDPVSDESFSCGESVSVCGGIAVRCECPDGGAPQLSVSGAGVAVIGE